MEGFLLLMNSAIESWMNTSTMDIATDLSIAILCGVGLFFLLSPFLKDCPLSPASGNKTDIPKDVKRGQSNTRRKTDVEKGCRDGGKTVEETKTPSQPTKMLTRQLLQDSTPQLFWNSSQKLDHLLLSQLFSSLMSLEDLILQKFNRRFWGTSSIFSESVVAMAHVLRNPSFPQQKSVRFSDPCVTNQAPSQAQGLRQQHRYHPRPHRQRKTNLVGVTWIPEKKILPISTPKQIHPCLKRRANGVSCPTTEKGIQTSLPPECLSHKHGLYSKAVKGYVKQNHQKAIGKPPGNWLRDTLKTKAIRPASEHLRMFLYHKEPQTKDKATNVGEQQGTCIRSPPSKKLKQLQGRFPPNTDHYCKRRPQLSQPGQPSILNSKSYKLRKIIRSVLAGMTLMKDRADCTMQSQFSQAPQSSVCNAKRYKYSKRMGSVPRRVPLKKDTARYDMGKPIKKCLGAGTKNVPHSSCTTLGKRLRARNLALKKGQSSVMNPTGDHCLHDSKAEMKLASHNTALPVQCRRTPYLQILEALNPIPPGVLASKLPRIVFPSSPICDFKEEYYSKAATVLKNLHHQDPGGTRVKSTSAASLESALSMCSAAKIQKTQRAPPPAASRELSKTHTDLLKRHLSTQHSALYFEQGRIIQGTGKGSLQQNTNPQNAKHAPLKSFHEEDSRHHSWNVTMVGPGKRVPPAAAKQTKTVEVKKETPYAWRGSLGSNESHTGKDINISPRVFGSLGAKRSPGHLQTCTPQHSQDSTLRTQGYRNIILCSNKQPQPRPGRYDPECPSTVHPAKVSLSSEHSMSSFQNTCQKPKTAQGSCDVFLRKHERADSEENRVLKDKIGINRLKDLCPHKERQGSIRPTAISQGERLGRSRPCSLSSRQLKGTAKTRTSDKRQATSKSSWKSDIREVLKYGYVGSKDIIGQKDTSKKDQPPAVAERTEEDWTGEKAICSMIADLQYLTNFLFKVMKDTEWDLSKLQGCEVESLTFQLDSSSDSSEGDHDINQDTSTSTMSFGQTSPEMHNCSFTNRGIGDKTQSEIKAKTACDQHLNQLPMPKEYDLSCRYRGIQQQQELDLPDQTFYQYKLRMTHCPHGSTKGHNYSFGYRKLGDQQQPGFTHKALDPHQSAKEGMGCVSCLSPKGSRPVKHRITDCFSP